MVGSRVLGSDSVRYFLYINGRWRWRPTKSMRGKGFRLITMGKGGPGRDPNGNPSASPADRARAVRLNGEWDEVRRGVRTVPPANVSPYPAGSVGWAYERAIALRAAERSAAGKVQTREQAKRDDWPRAWKWLGPVFGDVDPRTIQPEDFLAIDHNGAAAGLLPIIERTVSVTERHRVVKVWRALWGKMATMGLCTRDLDPSFLFVNSAPDPRQEVVAEGEVVRLVKGAWRMGFHGLAACLAVIWDTQLSPGDARTLKARQRLRDATGTYFRVGRAKTGRAAAGTLSRRAEAILDAYLAGLPVELHGDAALFRNRSGDAYTSDTLGDDFRDVRSVVLGPADTRQIQDFRRSGTVEAYAGGAADPDVASKMANTINASARLRKTYNPVNLVSVRRADEARKQGRWRLREQKAAKSVTTPAGVTLPEKDGRAK